MSSDAISYFSDTLERDEILVAQDEPSVARKAEVDRPEQGQCSSSADEQLLEGIGRGDRECLHLLYKRHANALQGIAFRILRDTAEAEDLLQDIFLFIFRKAALFDAAKGSGRSWIFQVAYHRAFNRRHYLTARQHYKALQLDEEVVGPVGASANSPCCDTLLGGELFSRFKQHLSTEQQKTIELFFFEGYTLKEIAEKTGNSLSNVRSYYYRGLERLRSLVQPENTQPK